MCKVRSAVSQTRRVLGAVVSAVGLSAACGAAVAAPVARSPSVAPAAGSPAAVTPVTGGPARSLGEPAAAQDSEISAVAATSFGASGPQVQAWTRPVGSAGWAAAGRVLPRGFGSSYDASAATAPGGPVLLVAGAAPAHDSCINNGSVAISNVRSDGRLSPARLVSDQRGTGSFDDRPAVAVGTGGTVWVAWSQGPDADACQDVGTADHLEVAVSHDGGKTFGVPMALPAVGGNSAFGARLAPLSGGSVAVSWTEQFGHGQESVLVSVLGPDGHPSAPRRVLTGAALPLSLPGASFYDFPAGDIAALPGGSLAVAAPRWQSGHAVIGVAVGTPGGPWKSSAVIPPPGADLLLPAISDVSADTVRLLCAVHARSGDRLGYDEADLRVAAAPRSAPAAPTAETGLVPETPAPNGPGFFEIGEELSMTRVPGGLLAPVVVAGGSGARLETLMWRLEETTREPAAGKPAAGKPTAARAGPAPTGSPAARRSPATAVTVWTATAVAAVVIALSAWYFRRRAGASD